VADPASGPLRLVRSLAGTVGTRPDVDLLGTREEAAAWLYTAELLPAGTVRLVSAARSSFPSVVAAIAVAIADSAAAGTWPA
jgi:hypothetical protein